MMLAKRTLVLTLAAGAGWAQQQEADPSFDTKVTRPAYAANGPRVLVDEAHFNFHTCGGRYSAFCELMTNDGYRVAPGKEKFTRQNLAGYHILVIANALGSQGMGSPEAARPAFSEEECGAVAEWVRGGGALLLITDHAPMGSAAKSLGARFGVEMSTGTAADGNVANLVYSRENGLLGDHPITAGIGRVQTFTGQSLRGPDGSVALLKLPETAVDHLPDKTQHPAAGRAQAVALAFGKGRVVVTGEAAMLSAQIVRMPGQEPRPFGMNVPGLDNRQLALNIMHWLSGFSERRER